MGFFKFSEPSPGTQIIARLLVVVFLITIATVTLSGLSEPAVAQNLMAQMRPAAGPAPAKDATAPAKDATEAATPTDAATPTATEPTAETKGSFTAEAVKVVGPAVVRIDTERTVMRPFTPFFQDPFFRDFFGDDLPKEPHKHLRGQGSGFIIDKSGIIVTNAHVVDQADKVTVTLNDGTTYTGQVLGSDEVTDLAAIKITELDANFPVAKLGDSDTLKVGDWAIAVGNPLGFDNTVTLGIVSTLKRSSAAVGIPDKRLDFIQTDAAINPGNSGGPLLNSEGEVIGINTAIRADAMGIGFAIPINKAKSIIAQLTRGEKVSHPFLGIHMVTVTPEIAKENNADPSAPFLIPETNGALVMRVSYGSPALKGGLRIGDVITEIDGKPVTSASEVQNIVENSKVGQTLKLSVHRFYQTREVYVTTEQLK
ncbi:serine protease [Oscillatoriales cyanobacterium USR001]|nr:serine protease [Oscillatoriales cyanobacterium USR001]